MQSPSLLRIAAALIATLMIAGLAGPAVAGNSGASGASVAPAVKKWLDTSASGDRLQVIVTFSDRSGIGRLKESVGSVDTLKSVPMAMANLSAAQIRDVASWSETRSVWNNAELELYLDESTKMVKADKVWAGAGLRRPYLGTGIGVAVIDSGVDTLHPDLPYGSKVKKNFYVAGDPLTGDEPTVYVEGARQTDTEVGHGTHVSSTIAGTGAASGGRFKGVAPGADLYVFRGGVGLSILTWWAVKAFDWVIENSDTYNIRVISNSWGGGDGQDYDPADPVNVVSKAAYDNDIVVVFAAGNSGGPNMIARNSVSPYVVCVGAVDKNLKKAGFSSTGRPGGDMKRDENGLYRPTVMAPGVDIEAAHSSAGFVMADGLDPENPLYTTAEGTSMATPHVSGVVALMLEARPELSAQNVIDILEGTATNMPDYEQWQVGAGFVNAQAAVQAAEKGQLNFRPSTKGKTPEYTLLSSKDWTGTVLPAGYAVVDQTAALASDTQVQVGSGVDALYAEIEWALAAEGIYLQLLDPAGNLVEESAGLTDIGFVNFRTVVTTSPEPGTWTVRAIGRVNTVTDYRGFYGLYQLNKPRKTTAPTNLTTTTTPFEGTVLTSADAVHDSQYFTFSVPQGATEVGTRIDWAETSYDIDLYVYDANGRLAQSSTSGDRNWEEVSITGTTDPMVASAGLPAGDWTVEVRGWLVVAPEPFTGTFSVTHPAP
jgi:serine protease AprX